MWRGVPQTDSFISPRRNHSCCSFSKFMLVHGGLDQNGITLDDMWIFNMDRNTWVSPNIDSHDQLPLLSHHTCVPVFTNPNRINDIYSKKSFNEQKERVIFI